MDAAARSTAARDGADIDAGPAIAVTGPGVDSERTALVVESDDSVHAAPWCSRTTAVTGAVLAVMVCIGAIFVTPKSIGSGPRSPASRTLELPPGDSETEDLPACLGTPSPLQQLKGGLLSSICSHAGGGQNMLVFGAGHDSEFWMDSNPHGITHFLEDEDKWVAFQSDRVKAEVTKVTYTSDPSGALGQVDDEDMLKQVYEKLPETLTEKDWDLILVDGPGTTGDGLGRGQAIYAASRLVSSAGFVYVDDCEQESEQAYMAQWFVEKGWTVKVHDDDGNGGKACILFQEWAQADLPEPNPPCLGTPTSKQQLNGEIVTAICSHLGMGKQFLVFGTGFDSTFWMDSNRLGSTFFLEDHQEWISFQPDKVKSAVSTVSYTSSMLDALNQTKNETLLQEFYTNQLPPQVKNYKWDTVLVDAPIGFVDRHGDPQGPGRGQSIYAAHLLVKPDGFVYVDDCQRRVEDAYIQEWFVDRGWTKIVHESNGHGGYTCVLFRKDQAQQQQQQQWNVFSRTPQQETPGEKLQGAGGTQLDPPASGQEADAPHLETVPAGQFQAEGEVQETHEVHSHVALPHEWPQTQPGMSQTQPGMPQQQVPVQQGMPHGMPHTETPVESPHEVDQPQLGPAAGGQEAEGLQPQKETPVEKPQEVGQPQLGPAVGGQEAEGSQPQKETPVEKPQEVGQPQVGPAAGGQEAEGPQLETISSRQESRGEMRDRVTTQSELPQTQQKMPQQEVPVQQATPQKETPVETVRAAKEPQLTMVIGGQQAAGGAQPQASASASNAETRENFWGV